MNLWRKIKLLLSLKKNWKVIIEEIEEVKAAKTKSGFKSTEFWVTLLASGGAVLAASQGTLPPLYAAIAVSASTVAYTLSRGLVKKTDPDGGTKSGYKTSEFYIGLLADAGALLASAGGVLPPQLAALLVTASRISYSLSRGLAKQ